MIRECILYFNASANMFIRDLMKKYRQVNQSRKTKMQVKWIYEEDDLGMKDVRLEFEDLFDDLNFTRVFSDNDTAMKWVLEMKESQA